MALLDGEQHPFRSKADRDKLVGHKIKYLRHSDIDKTGRGYFFPKYGYIAGSAGVNLEFEDGGYLARGEIAEIVRLEKFDE